MWQMYLSWYRPGLLAQQPLALLHLYFMIAPYHGGHCLHTWSGANHHVLTGTWCPSHIYPLGRGAREVGALSQQIGSTANEVLWPREASGSCLNMTRAQIQTGYKWNPCWRPPLSSLFGAAGLWLEILPSCLYAIWGSFQGLTTLTFLVSDHFFLDISLSESSHPFGEQLCLLGTLERVSAL